MAGLKLSAITAVIALLLGLLGGWSLTSWAKAAQIERYETRIARIEADAEKLRASAIAAQAEALQANTDKAHAAATLAAQKGQQNEIQYRTITRTVEKIVDRPVYLQQCLDDDGLREINDYIRGGAGASDTGKSEPALP